MKKIVLIILALSLTLVTMTGIMLASALEQFDITVTAEGSGTVSPDGIVTVTEGETQSFTITPDENYAIEYVKFNGVVVISGSAEEEVYQTPAITENSTLEVKFYDLTSDTTLLTSPLVFKGKKDDVDDNIYTFTFGKVAGSKTDISDFGVSVAGKKYSLDETAYAKAMLSGYFGIGLYDKNNVLPENYSVTPYYTKSGLDSFGASTVVSKDMPETIVDNPETKLQSLTVSAGTLYPEFSPDVNEYYVVFDELPSQVPEITCTTNSENAQYSINSININEPATIVVTAESGAENTITINFREIKNTQINNAYYTSKGYNTTMPIPVALPKNESPKYVAIKTTLEDYSGSTGYFYIKFNESSIPDNIIVTEARFNFYAFAQAQNGKEIEFFICTEDWVTNYAIYTTGAHGPEKDLENRLNIDDCTVAYNSGRVGQNASYSPYSVYLKPDLLVNKDSFNFAVRAKYDGDQNAVNFRVQTQPLDGDNPPIYLTLSYFEK